MKSVIQVQVPAEVVCIHLNASWKKHGFIYSPSYAWNNIATLGLLGLVGLPFWIQNQPERRWVLSDYCCCCCHSCSTVGAPMTPLDYKMLTYKYKYSRFIEMSKWPVWSNRNLKYKCSFILQLFINTWGRACF